MQNVDFIIVVVKSIISNKVILTSKPHVELSVKKNVIYYKNKNTILICEFILQIFNYSNETSMTLRLFQKWLPRDLEASHFCIST
jgi:hypothetical protein